MTQQKCLVLDVETAPLEVYVWELKDQYVGLDQVKKDWFIMAWSAKWLGEPKSLVYYDTRNKNRNDKSILKPLWKLLNEADIIITQNGKAFDQKKIKARMMLHGLKPFSPIKHLDTYLIAKQAGFTSHSLEYLTDKFCKKYKKLKHSKFPGLKLWKECLKGNNAAWEEMKTYNIHDVLSTEELYGKIKAWAPQSVVKVFTNPTVCSMCGSRTQNRGYNETGKKRRVVCTSPTCGKWDTIVIKNILKEGK